MIGSLAVERTTMNTSLRSGGVGVRPFISVDLIPVRFDAVYVELAGRAEYHEPWVLGASWSVGYRWQAPGRL